MPSSFNKYIAFRIRFIETLQNLGSVVQAGQTKGEGGTGQDIMTRIKGGYYNHLGTI